MKSKKIRLLAAAVAAAVLLTNVNYSGFGEPNKAYADENNPEIPYEGEDYTSYVDPFVGTDVDFGQLFPGAVTPNGLVKLSPDTYPHNTDDHAGYDYSKNQIEGFSHTRIEGVGGQGAGGDILITPTYVQYDSKPTAASRAQSYSHNDETAVPGYYSAELIPKTGTGSNYKENTAMGKIKAELTANTRTGYHRYTFPKDGKVSLVVDLNYTYHGTDIRNAIMDVVQTDSVTAVSGRFSGRNVSGHGKYTMYFYMETNRPAAEVKTWLNSSLTEAESREGNDIGAVLSFDVQASTPLEVKVGVSPVSSIQAKKDMEKEMGGWDFDTVYNQAKEAWNEVLGKVKVENSAVSDPDGRLKKLFYTHLYHMFTTPVNATSTDNTFRGTDRKIYEADDYTYYDSWTLWDDFRKYPIIGLVLPQVYKDYIRSIADTMEYGIGTWGLDTQTVPTVRTEHAVALLADGIAKGFDDIDNLEIAYEKAKAIADSSVDSTAESLGYIQGRVDKTVESSYDDWAISLLAKHSGNMEDYNRYLRRSFFYKNLFKADAVNASINGTNTSMGLLWPKDAAGNFMSANPEAYGNNGLYQGTLWQYTWWDSNDVNGLTDLMGSKEKMAQELHYLYGMQEPDNGSRMLHTNSNEIDLQTPYLFNFSGEPYNTQYWVRQIFTGKTWNRYSGTGEYNPPIYDYVYKLAPQGFLETMDDDAGTMAAMYVAAAMGLFPMAPGDTTYQIGTPFFDKVTIDVGNGKQFIIEADHVSPQNYYIQSAELNGKSFNRTWIDYDEIIRGGTLKFQMGASPSEWAGDGVTAISSSDLADTKLYDTDDMLRYSTAAFSESDRNDGSIDDTLVISLQNTDAVMVGAEGENLTETGKVTVENVPEGLTAAATWLDDKNIRINFTGNAVNHSLEDSIGNLTIRLEDSLFSEVIVSKRREKTDIKIMYLDDMITFDKDRLYESVQNDGSITDTVRISLTGNSIFAGTLGEDFIEEGKIFLSNLPKGLSARAVKIDEKKLELSISGNAVENDADVDELGIVFYDTAFLGAAASQINGSNYGGMRSLVLDFNPNWAERLSRIIEEGNKINPEDVTASSFSDLEEAIGKGQELLSRDDVKPTEYQEAYEKIVWALDGLTYSQSALKQLEAEQFTIWSGGNDLKTETSRDSEGVSLGNLGGTYDGAWIGFEKLNFGTGNFASVTVRYVNNSSRCSTDSSLEIHLGSPGGELVQTIPLSPSGSSWNAYTTKTIQLTYSEKLKGIVDVYFVLRGTGAVGGGSGNVFVANLDWMKFNSAATYGIYQAENYSSWSGGALKTETSTTSEGESLTNIGATYDGAWVSYNQVLFGGEGLGKIAVRYAGNTGRCGADARIELHLDSAEGELIDTISIVPANPDWSHYVTAEKELSKRVTGLHDIYLVMRAATTGSNPFVANLDWVSFQEAETNPVDKTNLQSLYTSSLYLLEQSEQYEAVSFKAFTEAMNYAKNVLESDTADAAAVEQAYTLLQEKKAVLAAVNPDQDAVITPDHIVFDKYTDSINYGDKTVTVTGSAILVNIKNEDKTLMIGRDYTVTGSAITIHASYLETLNTDTDELIFHFSSGKDNILTIFVMDTTPEEEKNSSISPAASVFSKYKRSAKHKDVDINMTLNGNTFINVKNQGVLLTQGKDYTVSGSAVTIHTSYLDKLPKGIVYLTFSFSAGNESILAVTITDKKTSSGKSGKSGTHSGSSAPVQEMEADVVVDNAASGSSGIRIPIIRTRSSDGTTKDSIKLDEIQALEIIKSVFETHSTQASLIIKGSGTDRAEILQIQIPKTAAALFGQNNIPLAVVTDQVSMVLPADTMISTADQDIDIKISAVEEKAQIDITKEHLEKTGAAKILNSPVRIETNYALKTQVTLPVNSSDLPSGLRQLKEFAVSLAVLAEHSDGETRLQKGTIQYDKDGKLTGISVWIDKFSTFTLVKTSFGGRVKIIKHKQMPDKELNVKFSENLDPKTVTEDNVYVLDSLGNKMDTTILWSGKSIRVKTKNGYIPGETYTFYITKNVRYQSGSPIQTSRKYEFTIGNIDLGGTEINSYQNVSPKKVWKIRLKNKIDTDKFKNKNITVVDQYCNQVTVVSSVDSDNYIEIKPRVKYKSGSTYYIVINGVNYENGTVMDKAVWIKFSVK